MSKVAKTTIGLMIITMLSKVLGFFRETILVSTHGASVISDAYITAVNIPTVIFAIIGAALSTTFIPLYLEIEQKKGKECALKFSNNIFNIVIILSVILSILGFIFAKPIVKVFAMNFTGSKLILTVKFVRVIIFAVIFIGLSNIMTSWLHIKGCFKIPGLISIPYNIIIIISILISSNGNLTIMILGTLIAFVSQFICQYPFAYKKGFRYRPYINLKDEYIKKIIILIIPVIISVGVDQINLVVDKSLASSLGDGIISILNSANRLNGFVQGIFVGTIAVVIYPILSKLSIENQNTDEFSDTIKNSVNTIFILIIPIAVGSIVLATPIVKFVFERGKFDANDVMLTASALAAYSGSMIGFALRDVLSKVFYALKDTRTPMINALLTVIINIIMNLILMEYMGHVGLAFGTSISSIICILLLFIGLKKKINYFGQDIIIKTSIKCFISAIVMGIITNSVYNIINSYLINNAISLITSILVGAFIYIVLIMLFKVEGAGIIINKLRCKV